MTGEEFPVRLREKVGAWRRSEQGRTHPAGEWVALAPDVYELLQKMARDESLSPGERESVHAALAYFLAEDDLFPAPMTGPIGYIDDVGLALFALDNVVKRAGPAAVRRNWTHGEDILARLAQFVEKAESILGPGLAAELRELAGNPMEIHRHIEEQRQRMDKSKALRRN
jgi:uncharacterized membrane protein YkvA (DUF1232 family)